MQRALGEWRNEFWANATKQVECLTMQSTPDGSQFCAYADADTVPDSP